MTPDEARALLDGTTPGPWKWRWDTGTLSVFDVEEEPVAIDLDVRDSDLIAAAPVLAAMIAGMREEWGVVWPASKTGPEWIAWGFTTIEDAYEHVWDMTFPEGSSDTRFVRRYVTTEEEA